VRAAKWLLLLPLAAAGTAVWKEYPALIRYWRIRRM
jgi:hypothetical protein